MLVDLALALVDLALETNRVPPPTINHQGNSPKFSLVHFRADRTQLCSGSPHNMGDPLQKLLIVAMTTTSKQ